MKNHITTEPMYLVQSIRGGVFHIIPRRCTMDMEDDEIRIGVTRPACGRIIRRSAKNALLIKRFPAGAPLEFCLNCMNAVIGDYLLESVDS